MRRCSFVLALLLAGCATHPAQRTELVEAIAYTQKAANTGTLVVKRDAGFTAGGCNALVSIDRQLAGTLRPKQELRLHLPAATDHIISVTTRCNRGVAEAEVALEAGATKAYRISFGSEGDIVVQPTAY